MATKRKTVQSDPPGTPVDPSDGIWHEMGRALRKGDDSAARDLLAAGIPIYYSDDDTPAGLVMKKHPDGRRQLVRFDPAGDEVIRDL